MMKKYIAAFLLSLMSVPAFSYAPQSITLVSVQVVYYLPNYNGPFLPPAKLQLACVYGVKAGPQKITQTKTVAFINTTPGISPDRRYVYRSIIDANSWANFKLGGLYPLEYVDLSQQCPQGQWITQKIVKANLPNPNGDNTVGFSSGCN